MEKKYRCGLYIGRLQPLHVGHESIIRRMLLECDHVIIAIGSAQESGTKRNPFTAEQRMDLICNVFYREIIHARMSIIPINDRENPSNDASWGDYVFEQLAQHITLTPDVIYEGEEDERSTWYDNLGVEVVKVPRSLVKVAATELREVLGDSNDQLGFRAYAMLPAAITYRISEMREVIQNAKQN